MSTQPIVGDDPEDVRRAFEGFVDRLAARVAEALDQDAATAHGALPVTPRLTPLPSRRRLFRRPLDS